MGFQDFCSRLLSSHRRTVNISIALLFLSICIICYVLLLVLFLQPQALLIQSLVYLDPGNLKPTVVVALLSGLLSGATAAEITRSVEHSLWHRITPEHNQKLLPAKEVKYLARWATSYHGRLEYIFTGSSWLLKFSGIFMLCLFALNPIIVSGISQQPTYTSNYIFQSAQGPRFNGFLDPANTAYDIPGIAAAVVSMTNLTAPPSNVCAGYNNRSTCSVIASASSIYAKCSWQPIANDDGVGTVILGSSISDTFCSALNPNICATLSSGTPVTFANFTSGESQYCNSFNHTECSGDFAVMFGVYVMNPAFDPDYPTQFPNINKIDCSITFGNVTITQEGQNSPTLNRNTYKQSVYNTSEFGLEPLQQIYIADNAANSQYTFAGSVSGIGIYSLLDSPVGTLLLGAQFNTTPDVVASRIEQAFDMGSLLAFSRSPNASELFYTYTHERQIWVYDSKVLLILLGPLLATILGSWGRWWVGGSEVIGYDIVRIANMGPIDDDSEVVENMDGDEGTVIEKQVSVVERTSGERRLALVC